MQQKLKTYMTKQTGHTPGPWKVSGCGPEGNSGYYRTHIIAAESAMDISNTLTHVLGRTYTELEANAALIAQAPDLLKQRDALREALKDMLDLVSCNEIGHNSAIAERSRAALALCDGGAQ